MRILLLADIHANWPALQAIDEKYDLCVFLGDLVEYGLEPSPCISWVRQHARLSIRGNHDHGTVQRIRNTGANGYRYLTRLTREITQDRLTADERRFLARLPMTKSVTINDLRYLFVHATPRDPLDEYAPADLELWKRRLEKVDADVICVGHTHLQFVLEVENKLVINPGSVGQPRDGDPRAGYAVIEGDRIDLKRIEYPVEQTVQTVEESSLPADAKEMLVQVFRNGGMGNRKMPWHNGSYTEP